VLEICDLFIICISCKLHLFQPITCLNDVALSDPHGSTVKERQELEINFFQVERV